MKLQQECVGCILGQADRVASKIGANAALTATISQTAQQFAQQFDFNLTPPEVATPLYEALAIKANKDDLYKEAKEKATKEAQAMLPKLHAMLIQSTKILTAAAKIAVAGNVIDLATHHDYDLTQDVQAVLTGKFGVDHLDQLFNEMSTAKTLLYLADNAGEHIFDGVFLNIIKKQFPKIDIYYATRANAIINDVTLEEAKAANLDQYATLLSSGCKTPGFIYKNSSNKAQKLFDTADIVIAKGMGNFETMTEVEMRTVYHLFKVKCNVVANYVGHPLGSYMALRRVKPHLD